MKLESNFSRMNKPTVRSGEKRIRKEVLVFAICFIISIFLWFMIILSKESYSTLEFPVKFVNVPEGMYLVNKPDSILTFRISSGGFELLTLQYLSRRKPLPINLGNIRLEKQDGFYSGYYTTSRLASEIRDQFSFADELISISPENLYFRFEYLTGKMVPVVSNLKLGFKKQYRLSDTIAFTPSVVKIMGPENLIERIDRVETEAMQVSGIEGPVTGSCRLMKPVGNERVLVMPEKVEFSLQADRFTESTLSIPVVAADKNINLKIFPEKVNVTFLVSLTNFKRTDADLFTAVIDLPEEGAGKLKALVKLIEVPAFVEVTRIDPPEVDFLVIEE